MSVAVDLRVLQGQLRALRYLGRTAALPPLVGPDGQLIKAVVDTASHLDDTLQILVAEPLFVSTAAQVFLEGELRALWRASVGARRAPSSALESLSADQRAAYAFLASLPNDWAPFQVLNHEQLPPAELRQLLASVRAEWRNWVARSGTTAEVTVTELSGELLALPAHADPLTWLAEHRAELVVEKTLQGAIIHFLGPPFPWLGDFIRTTKPRASLVTDHGIRGEVARVTLHSGGFALRTLLRVPMNLLGESPQMAHSLSWAGFDEARDAAGDYFLLQVSKMEGSTRGGLHIHEVEQVGFPALPASAELLRVVARPSRLSWISVTRDGVIRTHNEAVELGGVGGSLYVGNGTGRVQES